MMEGPGADSEEAQAVSDIDTAVVVVGLKALDPEWPIRKAFDPFQTSRARLPQHFSNQYAALGIRLHMTGLWGAR